MTTAALPQDIINWHASRKKACEFGAYVAVWDKLRKSKSPHLLAQAWEKTIGMVGMESRPAWLLNLATRHPHLLQHSLFDRAVIEKVIEVGDLRAIKAFLVNMPYQDWHAHLLSPATGLQQALWQKIDDGKIGAENTGPSPRGLAKMIAFWGAIRNAGQENAEGEEGEQQAKISLLHRIQIAAAIRNEDKQSWGLQKIVQQGIIRCLEHEIPKLHQLITDNNEEAVEAMLKAQPLLLMARPSLAALQGFKNATLIHDLSVLMPEVCIEVLSHLQNLPPDTPKVYREFFAGLDNEKAKINIMGATLTPSEIALSSPADRNDLAAFLGLQDTSGNPIALIDSATTYSDPDTFKTICEEYFDDADCFNPFKPNKKRGFLKKKTSPIMPSYAQIQSIRQYTRGQMDIVFKDYTLHFNNNEIRATNLTADALKAIVRFAIGEYGGGKKEMRILTSDGENSDKDFAKIFKAIVAACKEKKIKIKFDQDTLDRAEQLRLTARKPAPEPKLSPMALAHA